jgi:hypothetical protein
MCTTITTQRGTGSSGTSRKVEAKFDAQNLKYSVVKNVPGGTAQFALDSAAANFEMQCKPLLKQTKGLDELLKLLNDVMLTNSMQRRLR